MIYAEVVKPTRLDAVLILAERLVALLKEPKVTDASWNEAVKRTIRDLNHFAET